MSSLIRFILILGTASLIYAQDLPPFEAALYAMTDGRRLNPCTYNPNANNQAVLTDPLYNTYNNQRSYDNGITFRRFELFLGRADDDEARCFLDLIKAKLSSNPTHPVSISSPPSTPKPAPEKRNAPVASPTTKVVAAPAPSPATTPAAPPAPTQPAHPSARVSPEVQSHYDATVSRASLAKSGLAAMEARMAVQNYQLRPDILGARSRVDALLQTAATALHAGDEAAVEENLRYTEGNLAIIEKFLGR